MSIISDNYGNLVHVSHFGISTGDKNGYYTLRAYGTRVRHVRDDEGNTSTEHDDASVYIRNLSTDKEQALNAAREYLASHYPAAKFHGVVNFDLDEIARMSREESERRAAVEAARVAATDFSVFQGGKYAGSTVQEVLATDKQYAEWFAGNWWKAGSDNERTAAIINAILAPEQKAAQEAQNATLNALREEIGAQTLTQWEIGFAGSFCRNIAQNMASGVMPSGRGLGIVLEILAKWEGRAGSKAYKARLAELQAKF
jgi:hypothetical protein